MKGTLTLLLLFSLATAVMSFKCYAKDGSADQKEVVCKDHMKTKVADLKKKINDATDSNVKKVYEALLAEFPADGKYDACTTLTGDFNGKSCGTKSVCKAGGADAADDKCVEKTDHGKTMKVCCCYDELCNGAPAWNASLALAAAMLLIINMMQ